MAENPYAKYVAKDNPYAKYVESAAVPESQEPAVPEKTIARESGILARGMYPVAVGGYGGAALGSMAGPPGMAAGALIGGAAVPIGDAAATAWNLVTPKGWNISLPSDAVSDLLTKAGLPVPADTPERVVEGVGSVFGGLGLPVGVVAKAPKTVPKPAAAVAANALKEVPATVGELSNAARQVVTRPTTEAIAPITGDVAAETPNLVRATPAANAAEENLFKAMQQAGWTPDRIQAKLKQLGPGATLADLFPFQGLQEAAAQTPAGSMRAMRVLGAREAQKQSDLLKSVASNLSDENYYTSLEELQNARSVAGKAQRDAALGNARIVKSDLIQRMLETPEGQQGLRQGAAIARLEAARTGVPVPKSETWFHGMNFDDPNIKVVETPTLRMLDAMKQGFDQILQPYRNKFTGKLENLGPYEVEVDKARRAVVDELRNHSDDYAKYLNTWGDYSSNMDALSMGRRAIDQDPEVSLKVVKNLTPAQKEFFQIGVARSLRDDIVQNATKATNAFKNRDTRDILQAAFPSKDAYNNFRQDVLRAQAKTQTANRANAGSATARRATAVMEAEKPATPIAKDVVGAGFDVATGNKLGLGKRIVNKFMNMNPKEVPDTRTPILDQTSMMLHSTDPVLQARMIARMRQRAGVTGTSGLVPPGIE